MLIRMEIAQVLLVTHRKRVFSRRRDCLCHDDETGPLYPVRPALWRGRDAGVIILVVMLQRFTVDLSRRRCRCGALGGFLGFFCLNGLLGGFTTIITTTCRRA